MSDGRPDTSTPFCGTRQEGAAARRRRGVPNKSLKQDLTSRQGRTNVYDTKVRFVDRAGFSGSSQARPSHRRLEGEAER